jgi:hypothetical protein
MESHQSFTLAEALNQHAWSDAGIRALVHIGDAEIDDFSGERTTGEISEIINKKAIDYIAVGNKSNEDQFERVLRNATRGSWLDGEDINAFKNDLVELLWSQLLAEAATDPLLLTTSDIAEHI